MKAKQAEPDLAAVARRISAAPVEGGPSVRAAGKMLEPCASEEEYRQKTGRRLPGEWIGRVE